MKRALSLPAYVLVTPARNEEEHIERVIRCVLAQTHLPDRWVIVNDGSTDATGEIAAGFAARHPWLQVLDLPSRRDRSFAAKAHCFNAGYALLHDLPSPIVGNVDADVSFDADYFQFLMGKFAENPKLGVAGTVFNEEGYSSDVHSYEGEEHVAGGCQIFRRECFAAIGGYVPTKIGVDWIAVTTARFKGWQTASFREKTFFHHRHLGTAGRSRWAAAFLYGEKDYLLGWHPLYEAARIVHQLFRSPSTGAAIAAGYVVTALRAPSRSIGEELMAFHRAEQLTSLRMLARRVLASVRGLVSPSPAVGSDAP